MSFRRLRYIGPITAILLGIAVCFLAARSASAPGQRAAVTPAPSHTKSTTSQPKPTAVAPTHTQTHTAITTIFWVGEPADSDNGGIANAASAWDGAWQQHYGGVDAQTPRSGYLPAGFTPHENPFYFALPYSDITEHGERKASASACPNAGQAALANYSWCKNSWIAITHNGKTAYAQWEDVGPFLTDDTSYVFGTAPPHNSEGERAGLDVSPALQTYLGLEDVDTTSWYFVPANQVPSGPWHQIITTSPGDSIN
jgi:hypothetical protein